MPPAKPANVPTNALLGFLGRKKSPRTNPPKQVNFPEFDDDEELNDNVVTTATDHEQPAITPKSVLKESIKVLQKKKE